MIDVDRLLVALGIVPVARLSDSDHLVARCPSGLHPDRTESWAIRHDGGERNGLHLCRSCGWSGDAYSLAQHVLGVSFPVAKAWVEEHATAEEEQPAAARVGRPVGPPFLPLPLEVVLAPLEQWPTPARRYAQERRGIEAWQVDRWGLGHASGGRLDGRIVLPIRDRRGRVASYTARAYAGQPVRYLTPREEEHADASVLFGEEHAWDAEHEGAGVVVVEGALNALAVERACEGPVLALGGSRVEPSTLGKLSRFRFVVVATDADVAGDKAAAEILSALSSYVPVARCRLPEGTDPANAPRELLETELSKAIVDVW
jgi:hypothetical protein